MDRTRDWLLLLMRPYEGTPQPTGTYPFGRAMAALAADGHRVVVGHEVTAGRASGWAVDGREWVRVEGVPVRAVHDRLAGPEWAALRARALAELADAVPVANPESVRAICRDKLATHRFLSARSVPLPPLTTDPEEVRAWGGGYLKTREGSKGEGVWRVRAGDDLSRGDFVQRAIDPAPDAPRVAVRLLAQRLADRSWWLNPAVARISDRGTEVVNVHSGARAARADDMCDVDVLNALARQTAEAFDDDPGAIELGLDFVLDADRHPWLIEVNSVPRGRLGALAALDPQAFEQAHVEACARPLRTLAAWSDPAR